MVLSIKAIKHPGMFDSFIKDTLCETVTTATIASKAAINPSAPAKNRADHGYD